MHNILKTVALAGLVTSAASAQISINSTVFGYTQDFDSLTQSGTAITWTNNASIDGSAGLAGWHANASTTPDPFQIIGTAGASTTTGQLKSYGYSTGGTDRALGTLPGDTSGAMRLAVQFVNNTAETFTGFSVSYDGEQWRSSSAVQNNNFTVAYQIFNAGAGSISASGYIIVPELEFNTPNDGGTAQSLDGNAAINRVAGISASISSIALAPGQELWIRWFDSNSTGIDHGIAIDNFSFSVSAVPEPSSFAALAGLGALGCVALRRRRSA